MRQVGSGRTGVHDLESDGSLAVRDRSSQTSSSSRALFTRVALEFALSPLSELPPRLSVEGPLTVSGGPSSSYLAECICNRWVAPCQSRTRTITRSGPSLDRDHRYAYRSPNFG